MAKLEGRDFLRLARNAKVYRARFRHPVLNGKIVSARTGIPKDDIEAAVKFSKALSLFINDPTWHTPDRKKVAEHLHKGAAAAFYGPMELHFIRSEPLVGAPEGTPQIVIIPDQTGRSVPVDWEATMKELFDLRRSNALFIRAFGELPSPVPVPWTETVDNYLAHLATTSSKEHQIHRTQDLKWWAKHMPQDLRDITPALVEKNVSLLIAEKKSRKTAKNVLEALKGLLNWAVRLELLTKSPATHASIMSDGIVKERRALTVEQIRLLLASVPERKAILYEVAIYTGYRRGELAGLKVSSFNAEHGTLSLPGQRNGVRTKNKKDATQGLPKALAKRLAAFCQGREPDEPLFKVSKRMYRVLRDDLANVGIVDPALCFHSLRHSLGSLLDVTGATPKESMAILRHSDANLSIKRYGQAEAGALRERLEAVHRVVHRVVHKKG
jgi:integrase